MSASAPNMSVPAADAAEQPAHSADAAEHDEDAHVDSKSIVATKFFTAQLALHTALTEVTEEAALLETLSSTQVRGIIDSLFDNHNFSNDFWLPSTLATAVVLFAATRVGLDQACAVALQILANDIPPSGFGGDPAKHGFNDEQLAVIKDESVKYAVGIAMSIKLRIPYLQAATRNKLAASKPTDKPAPSRRRYERMFDVDRKLPPKVQQVDAEGKPIVKVPAPRKRPAASSEDGAAAAGPKARAPAKKVAKAAAADKSPKAKPAPAIADKPKPAGTMKPPAPKPVAAAAGTKTRSTPASPAGAVPKKGNKSPASMATRGTVPQSPADTNALPDELSF
jgi:hypothetical protein